MLIVTGRQCLNLSPSAHQNTREILTTDAINLYYSILKVSLYAGTPSFRSPHLRKGPFHRRYHYTELLSIIGS